MGSEHNIYIPTRTAFELIKDFLKGLLIFLLIFSTVGFVCGALWKIFVFSFKLIEILL